MKIVLPLLCLVLAISPTLASFNDGLLKKAEAAWSDAKAKESDTKALTDAHSSAFPSTTFTTRAGAITALNSFIALMKSYRSHLQTVGTNITATRTAVLAQSTSVSPYTSTDLAASVSKVKQNADPNLQKVLDMIYDVGKGISRYDEIIEDAEGQLDSVVTATNTVANPAAVTQAVTEARDEMLEANSNSVVQLSTVEEELKKAKDAFVVDFTKVASDFDAISNPSPAFTAYINAFRGRW